MAPGMGLGLSSQNVD